MTNLDHNAWPNASGGLADLVGRLEERLDTLSSALDEVRATVQLLAAEAKGVDASPKPALHVIDAQEASEIGVETPTESPIKEAVETATLASPPSSTEDAEAAWLTSEANTDATIAETP